MAINFCSNCGKQVNEGNHFCAYCGVPIKDSRFSSEENRSAVPLQSANHEHQNYDGNVNPQKQPLTLRIGNKPFDSMSILVIVLELVSFLSILFLPMFTATQQKKTNGVYGLQNVGKDSYTLNFFGKVYSKDRSLVDIQVIAYVFLILIIAAMILVVFFTVNNKMRYSLIASICNLALFLIYSIVARATISNALTKTYQNLGSESIYIGSTGIHVGFVFALLCGIGICVFSVITYKKGIKTTA